MPENKIKPGTPLKKLKLNRETIKSLTGDSLRQVAAGQSEAYSYCGPCDTINTACPSDGSCYTVCTCSAPICSGNASWCAACSPGGGTGGGGGGGGSHLFYGCGY